MLITSLIAESKDYPLVNKVFKSITLWFFIAFTSTTVKACYLPNYCLSNKINFSANHSQPLRLYTASGIYSHTPAYPPEFLFRLHYSHRILFLYMIESCVRKNSIFGLKPVRPFNFFQQLAILELLDNQGIYDHHYDLMTTVKLTQRLETSTLTHRQIEQAADWRQREGATLEKEHCPENSRCNRSIYSLQKMGIYDPQLPPVRRYDYTLILGGNIQEMQLRMISLLSILHIYKDNIAFDLGNITALTCDRIIPPGEYKDQPEMIFLTIQEKEGTPMVEVSDDYFEVLTETSALKGIIYSLKKFCMSPEFYDKKKVTRKGYHPSRPVSFLCKDSYESLLYEHTENGFMLNDNFVKSACHFIKRYPQPNFFETRQRMTGNENIHRPTTKETVKTWLTHLNELSCRKADQCEFLAISNAPHTFYQHVAVLQGLEESTPDPMMQVYQLATAGAGASSDIPIGYSLDDVTKLFYLEVKHPPE